MVDKNKQWMSEGKVGCTFATLFAREPHKIMWETIQIKSMTDKLIIPKNAFILSIQFPENWGNENVRRWALKNNFHIQTYSISDEENYTGLRFIGKKGLVSWVQYFGPDSHVKTRQAPIPELCMCLKLPPQYYFKVGFEGILHLAHASIRNLSDKTADALWKSSHRNTKKILGKDPGLAEAAKVTFKNEVEL